MNPLDRPWLLHPAAVHFPIALLTLGLFLSAIRLFLPPRVLAKGESASGGYERRAGVESALDFATRGLLWLGTVAAWATMALGLLAEDTAPHVPTAWRMLNEHKAAAYWTVGMFTALLLSRIWLDRKKLSRGLEIAFLVGWLLSAAALVRTAWHGGELVYTFNVGTAASAAP